jgi:hypothetical protein
MTKRAEPKEHQRKREREAVEREDATSPASGSAVIVDLATIRSHWTRIGRQCLSIIRPSDCDPLIKRPVS